MEETVTYVVYNKESNSVEILNEFPVGYTDAKYIVFVSDVFELTELFYNIGYDIDYDEEKDMVETYSLADKNYFRLNMVDMNTGYAISSFGETFQDAINDALRILKPNGYSPLDDDEICGYF